MRAAAIKETAAVAFVDIAGFSAITDVFGDEIAIDLIERFEALVADSLSGHALPIKWIGDEAMLGFPDAATALAALGRLLPACRAEPRLPLLRTGIACGPVLRRGRDLFGATVNIAARLTAMAAPGDVLATAAVAKAAAERGLTHRALGPTQLRSVAGPIELFALELTEPSDPAWIDPVCRMHAPPEARQLGRTGGVWFCSPMCRAAYRRSPESYARHPTSRP